MHCLYTRLATNCCVLPSLNILGQGLEELVFMFMAAKTVPCTLAEKKQELYRQTRVPLKLQTSTKKGEEESPYPAQVEQEGKM